MGKRKIEGSRVIVTGASSGIGREIARELARRGANLILTARREDRLRLLADQLQIHGQRVLTIPGDITDASIRSQLLHTAKDQLGGLDILVNNAGIGAIGQFSSSDETRLRQVMEVDFFAPIELIRTALPILRSGNHPMIVNISSVLGHRAVPKKSEYCAAKFALHGFSDAIRAELTPSGIDVLLVSPSTTQSEFFDAIPADQSQLPWLKLGQMRADKVARKTVRAIRHGKHEIILSPGGKLLVWFDRLSPPLVNRLVARFG